jgi:hypothetical protein
MAAGCLTSSGGRKERHRMESKEFYLHIVAISKRGGAPLKLQYGTYLYAEVAQAKYAKVEKRKGYEYSATISSSPISK